MSIEKSVYAQGLELMRRPLELDEIEFRVQSVKEKGAILLAYKTARTDMNRLDESGLNWQNDYQTIDGKLFCEISIHNPDLGQWVSKCDTGTESNQDAQKGEASDAFKRAGFRWGIGRELYDFPFMWVNSRKKDDKFYDVRDWTWGMEYKDGVLVNLAAKDKSGSVVYHWKLPPANAPKKNAVTIEATKKASEKIDNDNSIDHLIYTIGLARSKQQVFDLVERSGIEASETPLLEAAIEDKIKMFA